MLTNINYEYNIVININYRERHATARMNPCMYIVNPCAVPQLGGISSQNEKV